MILTIETISYAMIGSGEGSGMIDHDCVFDTMGIPYIPARRIKGLLKASIHEVCEMLGLNKSVVFDIFGDRGYKKAKISISNLYIKDYDHISEEILYLKESNEYRKFLTKNNIKSFFSTLKQQTAIDENGIAKENTLRTYRVLKPGLIFVVDLAVDGLSDYEKACLHLTCLNLRRLGTARNRGLGEIKCSLNSELNLESALEIVKSKKSILPKLQPSDKMIKLSFSGNLKSLSYTIKTLTPILLSIPKGDHNTISTYKYISSLTVRGVLANKYIQLMGLSNENAQDDPLFYEMFLNGKLCVNSAYPFEEDKIFYPAPKSIQEEKGANDDVAYNILIKDVDKNTEPIQKFIHVNNEDEKILTFNPETIMFFHNTRDTIIGYDMSQGIFYYEAINKGQEFKSFIYGDDTYLKTLINIFGNRLIAEIGRSKSAQYGQIEILFGKIENIKEYDFKGEDELIITALSPIILYNDYGFPEISNNALKTFLENILQLKLKEIKIISTITQSENYISVWHSKSPREWAFETGSTFFIKLDKPVDEKLNNLLNKLTIEGIGNNLGLGFGKVNINWIKKEKYYLEKLVKRRNLNQKKINKSKKIIQSILESEIKKFFKNKGFEKAKNFKPKLSNSLIGRVEAMLKNSPVVNDFTKNLKNLEEKQAGENLKKAHLWKKLNAFQQIFDEIIKIEDFSNCITISEIIHFNLNDFKYEYSKAFWLYFFRYLRLFNKKG